MRFRRRPTSVDWLGATLILASAADLGEGEGVLEEALEIGIISVTDTEGRAVLPVFSSEQELLAWMPEGSPWIGVEGADVLRLFLSGEWDVAVVDHAGESPHELSREDVAALLGDGATG